MAGDAKEMPSDLSEFCRVCLQLPQASQYLDLSTIYDEEDHLSYSDCFTICTQIDLKAGIGVPHHLCKSCGLELQMSYDFHKKVEESKRVIEKYEKKMQDRTNEQQLLYKPLPQKVVQKNQQQDTNEQELNDATTFFLSPMVVEGNNLPQSQKTLDLTQDEQEYLGSSDEENGVELLSKIGSIRDTVADDQENEHLVPMAECIEIEEHLEMEDFQNLETLEEEESISNTEPVVIKNEYIEEDPDSKQKCSNKNIEEIRIENEVARYHITIKNDIKTEEIEIKEEFIEEHQIMEVNDDENTAQMENEIISRLTPKSTDSNKSPFIYKHCGYSLTTRNALSQHYIREHPEKERNYANTQEITQDQNPSSDILEKSQKKVDNTNSANNTSNNKDNKNESEFISDDNDVMRVHKGPTFQCSQCNYKSITKEALNQHRYQIHSQHNSMSLKTRQFSFLAQHSLIEHHDRKHDGNIPPASLKVTRTSNFENKTYTCDYCGDKLPSNMALVQHRHRKHRNNKLVFPFECPLCTKGFRAVTFLKTHVERKHVNMKLFICEHRNCGKIYETEELLKQHLLVHKN